MSASSPSGGPGSNATLFSAIAGRDIDHLALSAEEMLVYSLSLGSGIRVDEAVDRLGMGEAQVLSLLQSLQAKGAVTTHTEPAVPARPAPAVAPAAAVAAMPAAAPRVAPVVTAPQASPRPTVAGAAEEEVELEPARRKELEELDRKLERGVDHFTALGVAPGASAEEVKKAYYEASRRFHPDRFYGKKLGSYRARIDRIFLRLTEAHQVLTQPERREAYLAQHPHLVPAPPPAEAPDPESEQRRAERQARLARHPYLMRTHRLSELVARGRAAISRGEYEQAFSDLSQASQLEPKNRELAALLSEARKRHEQQRAARELERGRKLEAQQDLQGAMAAYRVAYTLAPQSAEAVYMMARLASRLSQPAEEVRLLAARAVELAPERAAHHVLLAQALLQLEQRKAAREHLQEALRLEPDNDEARACLKRLGWSLLDFFKR